MAIIKVTFADQTTAQASVSILPVIRFVDYGELMPRDGYVVESNAHVCAWLAECISYALNNGVFTDDIEEGEDLPACRWVYDGARVDGD